MVRLGLLALILLSGVLSTHGESPLETLLSRPHIPLDENRICFSDHPDWEHHPAERIRHRYDLYKQSGCQMIRVHALWRAFEPQEGQWDESARDTFLDEVKRSGFKIKLIPGVMMEPPQWLYRKYPGTRMIDQYGHYSRNCISHWYPGLKELLASKLRRILKTLETKDMLHQVEHVVIDLGPAGEGIYPANWTMASIPGAEVRKEEAFACYSPLAQQDFRREMQKKYGGIETANRAWGTAFEGWDAVEIPQPGTIKGKFWKDVLLWYRDSKRKTFRLQIENVVECIKEFNLQAKPMVYLPGQSLWPEDIEECAKTGDGNHRVRLMIDNEYLMKLAHSYGCILQNTGFENVPEVHAMKRRMKRDGIDHTQVWGENAGHLRGAGNPVKLANIVIDEGLWGLDYTHTLFVFEEDSVTPNERLPELVEAVRLLRQHFGEER